MGWGVGSLLELDGVTLYAEAKILDQGSSKRGPGVYVRACGLGGLGSCLTL